MRCGPKSASPTTSSADAPAPVSASAPAPEGTGRVLVAMSGGVDSSVAALLLRDAGFQAAGVTMRLFDDEVAGAGGACAVGESTCCSQRDVEDARQVAFGLGIEHFTFNFTDLFGREVIDRFCAAYAAGRTPNPCIDCNRSLKFAALQRRRAQLGYDYVATGHYARRAFDARSGRWLLLRGRDAAKDQSYVLFHLTQDDLAHMLFPLGELEKPAVRALAEEHGFGNAHKAESQDICFVADGDYAGFIARYCGVDVESADGKEPTGAGARAADASGASGATGEPAADVRAQAAAAFAPGEIVDEAGRVLGRHRGLVHYTIGQRKGIGVAAREPLYVLAKDTGANRLVVGPRAALGVREVRARDVNLIAVADLAVPTRCTAKTHYRQRALPAQARCENGELVAVFDEPVVRPAPGQALVLYDGDVVIGGGTICASA